MRRWSSANQKECLYQTPWSWVFQPLELREISVCCLSHPVYGVFIIADWTKTGNDVVSICTIFKNTASSWYSSFVSKHFVCICAFYNVRLRQNNFSCWIKYTIWPVLQGRELAIRSKTQMSSAHWKPVVKVEMHSFKYNHHSKDLPL